MMIFPGNCSPEICGNEAGCQQINATAYTCICPHDSSPPTPDLKCPRRIIVNGPPRPIENILPPGEHDTSTKNANNNNHNNNKTGMLGIINNHSMSITSSSSTNSTLTATPVTTSASSSSSSPSSSTTNQVVSSANIAILSGTFLLFFFALIVIWKKRRACSKSPKTSSSPSPVPLKRSILEQERYAPNPQYSVCPASAVPILRKDALTFLNAIGEGYFGKVFKGELLLENSDEMKIVAIKVLKESANKEAEEDFLREVDIMSSFKHPNILSLLGVVLREANLGPMMVFEYMPHGDLAEVLRSQKKSLLKNSSNNNNNNNGSSTNTFPALTSKDLLSVSLQIANGMKYLAAQRFVHRDLACRNCLVSSGPVVKISDFGMSRDVYTCDYYKVGTKHALPVRWMSPECLMYGRFTLDSDIWSYGIVLWEIYSFGKQPYFGHSNDEVIKLIYDGICLFPPEDCPLLICELMKNCWKTEPKDRIKFTEIYETLDKEYQNYERQEREQEAQSQSQTQNSSSSSSSSSSSFSSKSSINFSSHSNAAKNQHASTSTLTTSFTIENECKPSSTNSTLKRLPRPPLVLPNIDLLDGEGYLLPKEPMHHQQQQQQQQQQFQEKMPTYVEALSE